MASIAANAATVAMAEAGCLGSEQNLVDMMREKVESWGI